MIWLLAYVGFLIISLVYAVALMKKWKKSDRKVLTTIGLIMFLICVATEVAMLSLPYNIQCKVLNPFHQGRNCGDTPTLAALLLIPCLVQMFPLAIIMLIEIAGRTEIKKGVEYFIFAWILLAPFLSFVFFYRPKKHHVPKSQRIFHSKTTITRK